MAQATVDTNTRRRDFLALTAAIATTVMAARPVLASPPDDSAADPIFGQIAAHAQLWERVGLAEAAINEGRPLFSQNEFDDLCSTEMPLFLGLLEVAPTTLAGVIALVNHLEQI